LRIALGVNWDISKNQMLTLGEGNKRGPKGKGALKGKNYKIKKT